MTTQTHVLTIRHTWTDSGEPVGSPLTVQQPGTAAAAKFRRMKRLRDQRHEYKLDIGDGALVVVDEVLTTTLTWTDEQVPV